MVGSETADRDPPEGGEDVPVDLPAVTVPGRLGQSELLPGKPLTGQVGAPNVSERTLSLRPFSSAARRAASYSASAWVVPAGCQRRRSFPVTGSNPSYITAYQRLPLRATYPLMRCSFHGFRPSETR